MKIDELRKQEEELEQERTNFLEADDNKGAKRIEKKLNRVRDLIEVEIEEQKIMLKDKLKIYKDFIERRGLQEEFNKFYEKEVERL